MKSLLRWLAVIPLLSMLFAPKVAAFSSLYSFEHPIILINEFSDIKDDIIYTPEIQFSNTADGKNKIVIHWYELFTNRSGEIIIESNTIGFPVIKVANDKIFHVDYMDHNIKVYNMSGKFIRTIFIENDYLDHAYPSGIMPLAVGDNVIVIDNIFSVNKKTIQVYNWKGEQLNKFSKFLKMTPCQNIVHANDKIYCFYLGSVETFDILGNEKNSRFLKGDDFNQYSQYVGSDGYFAVIGNEFLTRYTSDFHECARIALDVILGEDILGNKLDIDVRNLKLISSDSYLYILDLHNNIVTRFSF
ncbi:MAG: hypothetical protein GX312_05850 [Candidatus Phytoplasma sp.]|nr:hypothetical protein [Phytoplasma sp.]